MFKTVANKCCFFVTGLPRNSFLPNCRSFSNSFSILSEFYLLSQINASCSDGCHVMVTSFMLSSELSVSIDLNFDCLPVGAAIHLMRGYYGFKTYRGI